MHKWSAWVLSPDDPCILMQVCERGDKMRTKEVHEWSEWTPAPLEDDPCRVRSICRKTNHDRFSHTHLFGEWAYEDMQTTLQAMFGPDYEQEVVELIGVPVDPCIRHRECHRCDAEESGITLHELAPWRYGSAQQDCMQHTECRHCKRRFRRNKARHVVSEADHNVCSRCGSQIERQAEWRQ